MRLFYFSTLLIFAFAGSVSAQCTSSDSNPISSGMSFSEVCTNQGATSNLSVDWSMICAGTITCTAPAGSWGLKISFPASGEYGVSGVANVTSPSVFTWSYDAGSTTLTGYTNAAVGFGEAGTVVIQVETYAANSCTAVSTSTNIFITSPLDGNPAAVDCLAAFQNDTDDDSSVSSLGVDISLPIELAYFNAKLKNCKTVDLNWATASELNNEKFIVERKFGTKQDFVPVAVLQGAGNSSSEIRYDFQDNVTEEFSRGAIYYRLKQIDFDGKFGYSNVISVDFDCADSEAVARLFPNPVVKNLNVQLPSLWEGDAVLVEFYNEQGRLVKFVEIEKVTDLKLQFNVADLPAGVYNLKLSNNNAVLNKRFIRLD